MLVNHGKTESSNDFFGGTFWGTGGNPSNSKVARVDEGAGDVAWDASSISQVDFVGYAGSGKCVGCSVNRSSLSAKRKSRCCFVSVGQAKWGRVGEAIIRSHGPVPLNPLRNDTPYLSV